MKIHLRADSTNKEHTCFTIFIDGKNCGNLCMGTEDAQLFSYFIKRGASAEDPGRNIFLTSGNWHPEIPIYNIH